MSDIGPDLPPHLLAKRKWKQDEAAVDVRTTASGAKQTSSPGEGEKRRRVMGPAPPPAPLDERPREPARQAYESDSDDEDDFGPVMPTQGDEEASNGVNKNSQSKTHLGSPPPEEKLKRDDWMMVPPKQDDLAARMDPTKQRARGFNTGKGARAPPATGGDSSAWNETLEQKQKRLADEMMGVSKASSIGLARPNIDSNARKDDAAERKIRERTDKARGPSLMDTHSKGKGADADDDPSKRAFDREKDMASGQIGRGQRKELLNKASEFSSKFSGGGYL